jgi:signal transduction histidine kinase
VGLAIVKKIMEDTGGKIAVTSKKAQGATFIVSIKK